MKLQEILEKGIKNFRRKGWKGFVTLVGETYRTHLITANDLLAEDWEEHKVMIKKEGWVNLYPICESDLYIKQSSHVHKTKEGANCGAGLGAICIKIEWEEEE